MGNLSFLSEWGEIQTSTWSSYMKIHIIHSNNYWTVAALLSCYCKPNSSE